jgi:hypothetical protein
MTFKLFIAPLLAACAATLAIAASPAAFAQEPNCTNSGGATVCQSPGNSSEFAAPPAGTGANSQNGSYGPAGDTPPVGGGGAGAR